MFFYSNHKFHANGICFALPDNFFLHPSNKAGHRRCVEIEAADHSYIVAFGIDEPCRGTEKELQSRISADSGMTPLGPITPITLAGFSGHSLMYGCDSEESYEMRLSLCQDAEFFLYITTQSCNLSDVMASSEIAWTLQQIGRSEL